MYERRRAEGGGSAGGLDGGAAPGKRTLVQRLAAGRGAASSEAAVQRVASAGVAGASAPLPHADAIQAAFGRHDVSHVRAAVGGEGGAAARSIGATAYATGERVAFDGAPDVHTAAHEAAHVVQQARGVSLKGGVGAVGDAYERHADAVADAVVAGRSAEALLDAAPGGGGGGGIQRSPAAAAQTTTTAAPAATTEEQVLAELIAVGVKDENELTNAVFFHRHPELEGTKLKSGSPEAKEWLAIRNDLVRPALVAPPPVAAPPPAEAAPAEEPGMLDSALGAVTDVVNGAIETVSGAVDSVTGAVGDAWTWLTGSDEVPIETPAPDSSEKPSGDAPSAQEPAMTGPVFESQLDNTFRGQSGEGEVASGGDVTAGVECNVTSLSMQLQTVTGSEQKVRDAVCDLLEKKYGQPARPGDRDANTQIEDLLLRRFFIPNWADGTEWKRVADAPEKPFYKGWYDEMKDNPKVSQVRNKKFHQMAWCMLYVSLELQSYLGKTFTKAESGSDTSKKYYEGTLAPALAAGGSVMLGTSLTTAGHVVLLREVLSDGITINDPYGMAFAQGKYVKNADTRAAADKMMAAADPDRALLGVRAKHRPDVVALLAAGNTDPIPGNMGERVFYTFEEVVALNIGKWCNIITAA